MIRSGIGAALLAVALAPMPLLVAQDATRTADVPQPINAMCPVMTDEEVVPKHSLEWRGRTIGFCCRKCVARFGREPEAFLANLPDVFGPETEVALANPDPEPSSASDSGLMTLFARSHVLVLHFPIGLLVAAAIAELLALVRRKASLTSAAHFCANLALPFAAWTFFAGLELEERTRVGPLLHDTLERHELLGQITAALVALVFLFGWRARQPGASVRTTTLWRLTLFASAVLVGMTAHAGGQLVYGLGYPF
jgi:uncharacterized membrane protein